MSGGNGEFDPVVYDAAVAGQVEALLSAAQRHPELVDAAHPRESGRTPLCAAAMHGHVEAVEALAGLAGSGQLERADETGRTAMDWAVWNGHAGVVRALVRLGYAALERPDGNGWTPMLCAAWKGHAHVVDALVRLGATSLDRPLHSNGRTAMHIAAQEGHAAVVSTLSRLGSAALDRPDNDGWTPAAIAAQNGDAAVVETLARLGSAALDRPINTDGWTPVHVAAQEGHADVVEALLRHVTAVDRPDVNGSTPLHVAAENGHVDVVEALHRCRSAAFDRPDRSGRTPLHYAAQRGHADVVETLHRLGSAELDRPDHAGATALHYAAAAGKLSVVETLHRLGAAALDRPNNDGATPLHCAAQEGRVHVVEALLRLGAATLDATDNVGATPLHYAAASANKRRVDVIDALLRLGSTAVDRRNARGESPLELALATDEVATRRRVVRLFVAAGVDLARPVSPSAAALSSYQTVAGLCLACQPELDDGQTVLHVATASGRRSAVEALLRDAAIAPLLSRRDSNGDTALDLALRLGHAEVGRLLLEADLDAIARLVDTASPLHRYVDGLPLHWAVRNCSTIVAQLLQAGAALDARDAAGQTPLHVACQHEDFAAVTQLLACRANVDAVSSAGDTALRIALRRKNTSVVFALLAASAAADDDDVRRLAALHGVLIEAHQAQRPDLLPALLAAGCNANDQSAGRTLLHTAVDERDAQLAALLIQHGADLALPAGDTCLGQQCAAAMPELDQHAALQPRHCYAQGTLAFRALDNAAAAQLPLRNWRSCAVVDFSDCPDLTEIPVSLQHLPDSARIVFNTRNLSKWSALESQLVAQQSTHDIVNYARLKAEGGQVPVLERKLMAVGFAAVGKTTLIRRLRSKGYKQPKSTDGVAMGRLCVDDMELVVWDFAGQPLYRHTHLLFLRNAGLCLLVFKLTDPVADSVRQLAFWCDTIAAVSDAASQCRLLLVGTHLDRCRNIDAAEHTAKQVWQQLHDAYQLSEPVLVSCANGRSSQHTVDELRAAIGRAARAMDVRAPACMEVARAALTARRRDVPLLSVDEAHALIAEHAAHIGHRRLADDAQLRELSVRGLQSIGAMMAVQARGRITHVATDPQWLALLLATVVTTRHRWTGSHGRVSYRTLSQQVWTDRRLFPLRLHATLAAILQQLNVLYPLLRNGGSHGNDDTVEEQEYFVPSALSEQQPDLKFVGWSQDGSVREWSRLFALTDARVRSIPVGVLPSIVAQVLTATGSNPLVVWQQGGVFRTRDPAAGQALVCVRRRAADQIELIVQCSVGNWAQGVRWLRDGSTTVRNQLTDVLHADFDERTPCPSGDGCHISLDRLRLAVAGRQLQVCCTAAEQHESRVDALAPDLLFADLAQRALVHDWHRIELGRLLGRGASGRVLLGTLVDDNGLGQQVVAVKLLEPRSDGSSQDDEVQQLAEFQHEAYLMSLLQHPNVVRLVGVCLPSSLHAGQPAHHSRAAMLMELVGGGTLYDALADTAGLLDACKQAEKIRAAVGAHHTALALHRADPAGHAAPGPLAALDQLADGALLRIEQVAARLRATVAHQQAAALLERLHVALRDYHAGAEQLTRAHNAALDAVLDGLQGVAGAVNELVAPIDWPLRLKLATDVVAGLAQLHALNPPMVHRDLKSPNVFLTRRLDELPAAIDWRQPLAKVGDFGLSIWMLGARELSVPHRRDDGAWQRQRRHALEHLTPTWAAPEVLSHQAYGSAADVYAVGVVLWELLTRQMPFADVPLGAVSRHVQAGQRPPLPRADTALARDYTSLIEQCWQQDAERRPSIRLVYAQLVHMCRRAAPDLAAALPELAAGQPATWQPRHFARRRRQYDYAVERVERIALPALLADSTADEAATIRWLAEQRAKSWWQRTGSGTPPRAQQTTDAERTTRVHCVQHVGGDTFWLGLDDGSVVQMDARDERQTAVSCLQTDRHSSAVNALNYNRQQCDTVWSGASDGRIFVWSARVHAADEAVATVYLRANFYVLGCSLRAVKKLPGQPVVHAVLRNGRVYLYDDAHVGPSIAEVAIKTWLLCSADDDVLTLASVDKQLWLQLRVAGQDEVEAAATVRRWHRSVAMLVRLDRDERWLTRVASSTQQNRAHVIGLETVGGSTWSLAQSGAVHLLTEWLLLEAQHGLDRQLRLEPGRRITVDMSSSGLHPRLQRISKMLWVANDVMWLAAGNGIAVVDLSALTVEPPPAEMSHICSTCQSASSQQAIQQSASQQFESSSSVQSSDQQSAPDQSETSLNSSSLLRCSMLGESVDMVCLLCQRISASQQPRVSASEAIRVIWPDDAGQRAVQLLALVGSEASPSGFEVWSYAQADEAICVWQTPLDEQRAEASGLRPLQIASAPLPPGVRQLRCLQQVNASEVWAGTTDGTVIGWHTATRQTLPAAPLSERHRHENHEHKPRDACALAAPAATPTPYVMSAGLEPTLRRITLVAQRRPS